jgi:5'-3' exoribonuclease 4
MFDILFVRDTNPLTAQIAFLYQIFTQSSTTDSYVIPIDPAARFV